MKNIPDSEHLLPRDALAAGRFDEIIHSALCELAQHRSLTRTEIRLRCIVAKTPWRKMGINPSLYYRQRRSQRLASEVTQLNLKAVT